VASCLLCFMPPHWPGTSRADPCRSKHVRTLKTYPLTTRHLSSVLVFGSKASTRKLAQVSYATRTRGAWVRPPVASSIRASLPTAIPHPSAPPRGAQRARQVPNRHLRCPPSLHSWPLGGQLGQNLAAEGGLGESSTASGGERSGTCVWRGAAAKGLGAAAKGLDGGSPQWKVPTPALFPYRGRSNFSRGGQEAEEQRQGSTQLGSNRESRVQRSSSHSLTRCLHPQAPVSPAFQCLPVPPFSCPKDSRTSTIPSVATPLQYPH